MRMGSDSGRNFLSTKDPVKSNSGTSNSFAKAESGEEPVEGQPSWINEILSQFYFDRSRGK